VPHVHEVDVNGEVFTTGPDILQGGEIEPAPVPPPPGELRVSPKRTKATPAGQMKEIEAEEAIASATAFKAGDPDLLPEFARSIWDRMFTSAKRYLKNQEGADRYAAALAWRAVRQKYNLKAAPVITKRVRPRTPGRQLDHRKTAIGAGTLVGRQGTAWRVRVTEEENAEVLYEKTEDMPLPFAQGASVLIGIGPGNHRNIINIDVPGRLISEGHGGAGAVKWVRRHWDRIWTTAKASAGGQLTATKRTKLLAPRVRTGRLFRFKRYKGATDAAGAMHFVTDPHQATEQIVFGEVYVPFEVDLQGEYADEGEVQRMAWDFIAEKGVGGEMHSRFQLRDGSLPGVPVESFVARRGDPDFTAGAWVMGQRLHDDVWQKVLTGDYIGYSIGGGWQRNPIRARAN
jgi:cation transport regulator ChaB